MYVINVRLLHIVHTSTLRLKVLRSLLNWVEYFSQRQLHTDNSVLWRRDMHFNVVTYKTSKCISCTFVLTVNSTKWIDIINTANTPWKIYFMCQRCTAPPKLYRALLYLCQIITTDKTRGCWLIVSCILFQVPIYGLHLTKSARLWCNFRRLAGLAWTKTDKKKNLENFIDQEQFSKCAFYKENILHTISRRWSSYEKQKLP